MILIVACVRDGGGGRDKHSVAIAFIVQGLSLYGETRERVCFARDDI